MKNEEIKAGGLKRKIISIILAMVMVVSYFAVSTQEAYAAGEIPGTQAYYDARWEDAKTATDWKDAGAAYTDDNGAAATTTNGGPWNLELDWGNTCSFPWNGTAVAPTTTTTVTRTLAASNDPANNTGTAISAYEVYTAEQFWWCIANHSSFKLMNDIDLNGYRMKMSTPSGGRGWTADGNGHTVYNYYGDSIFGETVDFVCKNLRVKNSYATPGDLMAMFLERSRDVILFGCVIEDSLIYGTWAMSGFLASVDNCLIRSCYTDNLHIRSKRGCVSQIAEGLSPNSSDYTIENTIAINGSVISPGGHHGGFVSCNFGNGNIKNCFIHNVDVYGQSVVGSLFGVAHRGTHRITNCFASGKVEGISRLGGVIGGVDTVSADLSTTMIFQNVYSTSLVGVQKGNLANLGGFTGQTRVAGGGSVNYNYKDCYAAGEVGVITTNADDDRGWTDATVAGFLGNRGGNNNDIYKNCYFDAQMTGMKNWAMGDEYNLSWQCQSDVLQEYFKSWFDLKSVLTTDSDKCGTGLTSAPSSNGVGNQGTTAVNRSFTGFTDNSKWTFVDGYYPQLEVFSNPTTFTNTNWMTQDEMNNLVKACSLASVSTAKLNTWDEDYEGNPLPKDTYDTVRDVVAKAPLTDAANISWSRCGVTGADTLANGTGAETTVFGTTRDVITLEDDPAEGWQVKDPYPGVDWLRATVTVNGQSASRAFRLCPTSGLYAGAPSTTVTAGNRYDHADDMKMVYSTGARYAVDTTDLTYGVYPDVPLAAAQDTLLDTGGLQNKAALTALYGGIGQNDMYTGINVGNMQRKSTNITDYPAATTTSGNTLNTVIKKGSTAVDLTGAMGQKFNGNLNFAYSDAGDYSVIYHWSLNDGRFLTGIKDVKVPKPTEYTVTIEKEVNKDAGGTVTGNEEFTFTASIISKTTGGTNTYYTPTGNYTIERKDGTQTSTAYTGPHITVNLKDGDKLLLPKILAGYKVEVTEGADADFTTEYKIGNGQAQAGLKATIENVDEQNNYILFTNTKKNTLTVSKTVSPTDSTDKFTFTVGLTKEENQTTIRHIPLPADCSVVDGNGDPVQRTITISQDGKVTVELGHSEKLVIERILAGYTAVVTEAEDTRFETTYTTDGGTNTTAGRTASVTMDSDKTVGYTNTRSVTDLTIKKTVVGNYPDDTFGFSIVFTDNTVINRIPDDTNNPARYTKANDRITFNLKGGEQVTIPGIPIGTELTLTETKHDGFTASIYYVQGQGRVLIEQGGEGKDNAKFILEDAKTVEVINNPGVTLPKTGGSGTITYTISGLLMMATAVVVAFRKRRRRERRYE